MEEGQTEPLATKENFFTRIVFQMIQLKARRQPL